MPPGTVESSPLLGPRSGLSTPKTIASGLSTPNIRRRKVQVQDPMQEKPEEDDDDSGEDKSDHIDDEGALEQTANHSLLVVYSLLFALGYDLSSFRFLQID